MRLRLLDPARKDSRVTSAPMHDFLTSDHPRESIVWFQTGPAMPLQTMVGEKDDFIEFCTDSRNFWQQQLDSLNKIKDEGWYIGTTLGFGYAIAPENTTLEEASETVAQAIGIGTPIEFRSGMFCCGGCFAGERPQPPNPFPAWLIAGQTSKAVRVDKAGVLDDKLVELGSMGMLDAEEVESIVSEGRWTEPGFIEEFAGLGSVELVTEAWLDWVGKVDARAGTPRTGSSVGNLRSPIDSLAGPAAVWLQAAKAESNDLPKQFEEVVFRAAQREKEDAQLKVPVSEEQAVASLMELIDKIDPDTRSDAAD